MGLLELGARLGPLPAKDREARLVEACRSRSVRVPELIVDLGRLAKKLQPFREAPRLAELGSTRQYGGGE